MVTTETKVIEFKVNFGGFYCSMHGAIIDNYIEAMEFSESEYDAIEWAPVWKQYANDYLDLLEQELTYDNDIELNFVELISPKFYNYSTDQIIAAINIDGFNNLKDKYLMDQDFKAFVNETSKSYDGFTSFFSGLAAVCSDDAIFMEYLFNYFISVEFEDECINMLNDIEVSI